MYRPEDAIPDFEAVLKLNKDIACGVIVITLLFLLLTMIVCVQTRGCYSRLRGSTEAE